MTTFYRCSRARPESGCTWLPWGQGKPIKNAMNGDGDVLLVHAKTAEESLSPMAMEWSDLT